MALVGFSVLTVVLSEREREREEREEREERGKIEEREERERERRERRDIIAIQFVRMEKIVYMSMSSKPSGACQKIVEIHRILVEKKHRRQGHGRRTLLWALKKLFDGGAVRIAIFSPSKKGLHCVYCNFQSSHHSDTFLHETNWFQI